MLGYGMMLLVMTMMVKSQETTQPTQNEDVTVENQEFTLITPSPDALSTISPILEFNDAVVNDNNLLSDIENSDIRPDFVGSPIVQPVQSNSQFLQNFPQNRPDLLAQQQLQRNQLNNMAVPRLNGQPMMFPPGVVCYCCHINCSPNGVPQVPPVRPLPAPVAGQWSQWGEWSPCEDNFGVTSQTRRRTCMGGQCPGGEAEQARSCLQTPQQDQPPISQNQWSDWSNWSSCSASCGPGNFRTRARHCQCGNAMTLEDCVCIGENLERQNCPNVPCCVHSAWSEWSACSTSCGPNGLRQRVRVCSCGDGPDCDALGPKTEQQPCAFTTPCIPQRDDQCQNCVTPPPCVNCNPVCSYCPVGYTQPCYTCLSRKKREELLMEKGVITRK